jgi:hypothetical protein
MKDKTGLLFTRLLVGDIWLEIDINNQPRIVLKDETGQEWVLEQDGGQWMNITKKENSWYFDEKNRTQPLKGF